MDFTMADRKFNSAEIPEAVPVDCESLCIFLRRLKTWQKQAMVVDVRFTLRRRIF